MSLSEDAQKLYVNVGIEKVGSGGMVVDYYLARVDLADQQLELVCPLKEFASDLPLTKLGGRPRQETILARTDLPAHA